MSQMGKVTFRGTDVDNVVAGDHSPGRGPVLRSDQTEVARIFFQTGERCQMHHHPEEQTLFVEEGRIRVTLGTGDDGGTYDVERGQASFHPANEPHEMTALEDSYIVSFKNIIAPTYEETGRLL